MSLSGNPPDADVPVDAALVRLLLSKQHPDLSSLEIRLAAEGWDNMTFRLGDSLAVRLPRRRPAAELIGHEQRWLPELAPQLPLPIPTPVRTGRPADGYPWHWSIVHWFKGRMALDDPPLPEAAGDLGRFLRALHRVALPADPPQNPYRGGPLAERAHTIELRLESLAEDAAGLAPAAEALFNEAVAAPGAAAAAWLHGDLHPKNVITRSGRLAAVVDWGDMCAGDPATDLAALWCLFDVAHHRVFWDEYGPASAATMLRARGWALSFGLMHWDAHHVADPAFAASGMESIRRSLEQ